MCVHASVRAGCVRAAAWGLIRVRVGGMGERRLFGGGGYWVFWV